MGRNASGVRGMNLGEEADNEVIGMIAVDNAEISTRQVMVVSEKGYGKRSAIMDESGEYAYRMVNRGGKGVKTMQVTDKTGNLIAIKDVEADDQLMIINRSGLTIRMGLDELRVLGRATQGVRLIELRKNDQIAAVAKIDGALREEEEAPGEGASTEGDESASPDGTELDKGTDEE
jgi:DNA gyrase subunit A